MHAQNIDMPPPGEFIKEELVARGWIQRDLAYVLGVPEQSVNMLVSGKRGITADMAKALADAFDVSPEFFLNLQTAYDLARAQQPNSDVARRARLQSVYPIREMVKRGWIVDGDATTLEKRIAEFFEVSDATEIPELEHAAKKSGTVDEVSRAQRAWLFRARKIAREIPPMGPYTAKTLRAALDKIHALMVAPEEARHVPRILSECGVRFVLIESLPGGKIDGACFWLDGVPVIGMSCRHDRIDNFWFVLRHEIEHVLQRHGVSRAIVDDLDGANSGTEGVPEQEKVANAAAAEFCVPVEKLESFVRRKSPYISDRDLVGFATLLGVHPGIVAGRLRWKLNNWTIFSKHLVKVRPVVAAAAIVDGWGHAGVV